jgi:hypothetical protein
MRWRIGLKATLAMSSIYFCTGNVSMYFIEKHLREKQPTITIPHIILYSTMISLTSVLIFLIAAKLKYGDIVQIRFATTGLLITVDEDYDDEERQKQKQLVTEEDILKFPEIEYKSTKIGRDGGNVHVQGGKDGKDSPSIRCHYNDTCSICIENYQCKERVRALPCGHIFHTDCIVPWLSERSSCCPICKEPVRKETRESTKEV